MNKGRTGPVVQTMIVGLTSEHVDGWVDLYNRFHRSLSWVIPTDAKECLALMEEGPASCSYVVLRERNVVAIGTLDMRGSSATASIRNFAFRHGHQDAARSLLDNMAVAAKEKGFACIDVWMYDSVSAALGLLNGTGFTEKGSTSLMLTRPDEHIASPCSSPVVFRSLADGLSIASFVEASRAAFEADGSRLLETTELERWVSDFEGFDPGNQLAAQSGNAVVGTVMSEIAKVRRGKSMAKIAWVYGLGVIPGARRKGIGTGLMDELLKRLQSHGVCEVWLVTDAEGGIRAFYEQVGFRHYTYFMQYSRPLG